MVIKTGPYSSSSDSSSSSPRLPGTNLFQHRASPIRPRSNPVQPPHLAMYKRRQRLVFFVRAGPPQNGLFFIDSGGHIMEAHWNAITPTSYTSIQNVSNTLDVANLSSDLQRLQERRNCTIQYEVDAESSSTESDTSELVVPQTNSGILKPNRE